MRRCCGFARVAAAAAAAPCRPLVPAALQQQRLVASASAKKAERKIVGTFSRATTAPKTKPLAKRQAQHPSGAIATFDPEVHRYTGPQNTRLKSITSILRSKLNRDGAQADPVTHPFDAQGIAEKVAAAQGKTVEEVLAEWAAITENGTKFHNFIYEHLTGRSIPGATVWGPAEMVGAKEVAYQQAFIEYMEMLKGFGYEVYNSGGGAEMIVWSPSLGVAGTIDCLMHCKKGNALEKKPHMLLLDWKTNVKPLRTATVFPGNPATLNWPFEQLPNVKLSEYKLQLNCYKHLLEQEGYVRKGMVLKMAVVQFIQTASGDVEVDGMEVEPQDSSAVDSLFRAAVTTAKPAKLKKPFS